MQEDIKIYWRGLDLLSNGVPKGPRVHPILNDPKGIYYELANNKGKILILNGDAANLSKATKRFFNKPQKPNETAKVDKNQFLKAVLLFAKENNGKKYHLLNFKKNSIGFKNFVLKESRIK